MYCIKKNYKDETKKILKVLNEEFYMYSKVTIDLKEGKLFLNDNKKTELIVTNFITIEELIHANFGTIKIFNYMVSGKRL